jgi:pectinesterase
MKYRGLGNIHNETEDDSKEDEEWVSNIVIMGVSMLLLALVTIAVVANIGGSENVAAMKNLSSVCAKTDAPESCLRVLKRVGETATAVDYAKAALKATLKELSLVNIPKPYLEKILTPLQTQSYRDCLELLNMGKDELESLYKLANSSIEDIFQIYPNDVMNSLSAIISYQQTCVNELVRTNSYEILGYSLKIPILLTRITLAIVYNFVERPKIEVQQLDGFQRLNLRAAHKLIEVQHTRIVVAQDGSGQFSTITESLNYCANNRNNSCVIYVTKGKYEEKVVVPKNLDQVLMYGDGPMKTIVTGIKSIDPKVATPFRSATFGN